MNQNPEIIQKKYYKETSHRYEASHCGDEDKEHKLVLYQLLGLLEFLEIISILDVGNETGRAVHFFNSKVPAIKNLGTEPVEELRNIGHRKGIPKTLALIFTNPPLT